MEVGCHAACTMNESELSNFSDAGLRNVHMVSSLQLSQKHDASLFSSPWGGVTTLVGKSLLRNHMESAALLLCFRQFEAFISR